MTAEELELAEAAIQKSLHLLGAMYTALRLSETGLLGTLTLTAEQVKQCQDEYTTAKAALGDLAGSIPTLPAADAAPVG